MEIFILLFFLLICFIFLLSVVYLFILIYLLLTLLFKTPNIIRKNTSLTKSHNPELLVKSGLSKDALFIIVGGSGCHMWFIERSLFVDSRLVVNLK